MPKEKASNAVSKKYWDFQIKGPCTAPKQPVNVYDNFFNSVVC